MLYPKLDWAPQFLRAKTTLQALGQGERRRLCPMRSASPRLRSAAASSPRRSTAMSPRQRYVQRDARRAGTRFAVPRPICRSQDLAARRHPDQGRPRLDGGQPGGARAVARPPPRRIRRPPARRYAAARRHRQMADEARARLAAAATKSCTAARWASSPRSRPGSAARSRRRRRRSPAARRFAETGWFDAEAIAGIAEAHQSGRADHGRLLWQLLMLEKSLRRLFGFGAVSADRAPRRNRGRRAAR